MWGSRIIFAGPSKFFTKAYKDQQRDTIHAVNSVRQDCLNKSVKTNIIGELRSESISKVKISLQIGCDILSNKDIIENKNLISSGNSTELTRVMVKAYSDCKYIGLNNRLVRLGSGTKLGKFQNLLIFCVFLIF